MSWWMGHYGHSCPKRHKAFCNNKWAGRFNLGKLNVKKFRETHPDAERPTTQYVDGSGRVRFKGLPSLKKTQTLCLKCQWCLFGISSRVSHCCSIQTSAFKAVSFINPDLWYSCSLQKVCPFMSSNGCIMLYFCGV